VEWVLQQGREASWDHGFSVLVGWVGAVTGGGWGGAAWTGPKPGLVVDRVGPSCQQRSGSARSRVNA
jgi:hypothetical protein